MKITSLLFGFAAAAALAFSSQTTASDGRIEINQASIEAAGGFPFTIGQPGAYVLTGNLTVPVATDGVIINSNDVSLDLNGFSISGPAVCSPTSTCITGDGEGIRPDSPLQDAHRVSVKNGTVKGFAYNCVRLRSQARVDQLTVYQCGRLGIDASARSVVTRSTINRTGEQGLQLATTSRFAHNSISESGLAGGGHPAVSGGTATAGNYCDDGSCGWADTRRRFYVTQDVHDGSQALSACAAGFHMASLWEILDPTQLQYDTTLGQTTEDSGFGPPSRIGGWVRTGKPSTIGSIYAGGASCSGYSTAAAGLGTVVSLTSSWDVTIVPAESIAPWWNGGTSQCENQIAVWCVQD
jgi:hypothetical protein